MPIRFLKAISNVILNRKELILTGTKYTINRMEQVAKILMLFYIYEISRKHFQSDITNYY